MSWEQFLWMLARIFNPIWVTGLIVFGLTIIVRQSIRTPSRKRIATWMLIALPGFYAIDTIFALPRILFSYGLSNTPVIAKSISLPRQLTLVNISCVEVCHRMLISGELDEVYLVNSRAPGSSETGSAVRYRADWVTPGTCPDGRQKAIPGSRDLLLHTGYCPLVETAALPEQGTFLVQERTLVMPSEHARRFAPRYLLNSPPGAVIRFVGVEVQNRSPAGNTILASVYDYEAPGILGIPPLLGCWERPDNVIWIMPPGDTGCGLWRWFTGGGNAQAANNPSWTFDVFAPPDRIVAPSKKPELAAPTPVQTLEILSKVENIEPYLAGLRTALIDPSNSDEALHSLILGRARRVQLEGTLIALLAANRPSSLTPMSELVASARLFSRPDAVIAEMKRNAEFHDAFGNAMVQTRNTRLPPEQINRFLNLMQSLPPR